MHTAPTQPHLPSAHLVRALVMIMVILDLALVGLAAWSLATSRAHYVQRAETTTHNLALVLEQNLLANIRQIDLVLHAVKDQAPAPGKADPRAVAARLRTQEARVPLLDALHTTDPRGRLEDIGPDEGTVTVAETTYFRHLQDNPGAGLTISKPFRDPADQAWVITLARRLDQPTEGRFRGIVFATVRLDELTRELAQVDVGQFGSISLRGENLELLARYPGFPEQDRTIGDTHISGDYLKAVQSGERISHFTTRSILDGNTRTYTFWKLKNPTFYILVGLSQSDYLQAWWRECLLSGSAVAGLLTLSFVIAWLARTAWRRQLAFHADREDLIQELTQALTEVKSLKGMLPICASCKKIRDDRGYWNILESYLARHTEATLTHGVCPDCSEAMRREYLIHQTAAAPGDTADGTGPPR